MEKISIKLEVSKINKSRITERKFTNKEGQEVTVREYPISIVPLKEPKLIKDGGSWKMWKKYFVVEEHTKEERDNKVEDVFLGDGIVFEYTDSSSSDIESPF